jgi:hypothetical protein
MSDISENVRHKADWEKELNRAHRGPPKVIVWDFKNEDHLKTFWFSDLHLGHKHCDMDLVHRNIEHVKNKGMPFADLGDLIENATRDSVGAGVYDQEEIADGQMDIAVALYEPIKAQLMSMQPGNHEIRTYNSAGVNLTRQMAKRLGVQHGGAGVIHYIRVGNQTYTVYSTHGGGGATTIGGKMNALLRLEKVIDADVYIQGHTHDTIYKSREYFDFDKRKRSIITRKKHFVNGGAYLDYWNTYGQVKAYAPGTKGSPQLRFNGKQHEIEVSFI